MAKTKSKGKAVKTTTATSPANGSSKSAPTQTTNAAVGGGGMGTANPSKTDEDAKEEEEKDPIDVVRGTVVEHVVDASLPGPVAFELERHYSSSGFADRGPLGRGGWTHTYHQWIEPDGDGFVVRNWDAHDLSFGPLSESGTSLHRGKRLLLQQTAKGFVVLALGGRWTHTYEPLDRGGPAMLRTIADAYQNRISLAYEGGRLDHVTDAAGREVRFGYDAEGRIDEVVVEVEGRVHPLVRYAYGEGGELSAVTDPLGRALRYAYDGQHRLIEKELRTGFHVRYAYDPNHGRVVRTWGDGGLHSAELLYDLDARTTTMHGEPEPRVFTWDEHQNVVRIATFDGRQVTESKWDDDHLLLEEKNAAGEARTFTYDARGFLVASVDPAGNETRYEHVDDLLRRVVHDDGTERSFEYDGVGGLSAVTLETGARTSVDRDGRGRITAFYGKTGVLWRRKHDARHQLIEVKTARGQVTTYAYDDLGRPIARRTESGETQIEYDAAGQTVAVVYPDGARVENDYDGLGNVVRVRKPGGDLSMERSGTGALTRLVNEEGGVWAFAYDRNENPIRIENPKGERHELRYDRAGRVAEERTFDGRQIRYAYNLSDRLHRVDRPDGTWVELSYDPLGHVVAQTSTHGTIAFERNKQGQIERATVEEGLVTSTVELARDAAGRVTAETQDGQTIGYAWDDEDRLVARTLPSGEVTRFAYDLDGDLAGIDHAGHVVQIERDQKGREVRRTIGSSGVATLSAYDAMDRLVAQDVARQAPHAGAVREALVSRRWTYDSAGRPTRADDARFGPTEYFYDGVHNLVRSASRVDEAFTYDPAGGLIRALSGLGDASPEWKVAEGDLLLRTGSAEYENDACGRRVKKTLLDGGEPTGEVTEYIWDCRDRLREVRLPNGDIARYFYDAFGRRTRKVIFPKADADPLAEAPPTRVVRFLWDGDVLAVETDSELGERVFVHEPDSFRPALQIEQGQAYTYVLDARGTPRELIDESGRIAWAAQWTAFGNPAGTYADPSSAAPRPVSSPFRLLGQYHDAETGLCATRYRYFDAETGRFCSPDPIGLRGGMRLLGYPGAPSFIVDPFGLAIDFTQIPDTPGVYHITTPDGKFYTGSAGGGDGGMRSRLTGGHKHADMMATPGATIEFFEVDLGTAKTRSEKEHVLRHFEQAEMDARKNVPNENGSQNDRRAEAEAKHERNKKEVAECGAAKKAKKKVKNT